MGEEPFEYLLEFEGQDHTDDTTVAAPIHRLAAKALVKDLEIEEITEDGKSKIIKHIERFGGGDSKAMIVWYVQCTVKPVLRGHLWDNEKAILLDW